MTAVKWAVFVAAILAARPAARWLRRHPGKHEYVWTLIGLLPFFPGAEMALLFFGGRPGDTQGFEVGLLDWLALTMLLVRGRPRRPIPYRYALAAYLLVAALSASQAAFALGAYGYVWKTCRMYLLFAAICRSGADRRMPAFLLRGLTLGIAYQGGLAIWQHYGLGMPRATGSFAHQNTLGALVNLVAMAPIALLLAGRAPFLTWLAPLSAIPISLFTVSRGTILFLGVGSVLVYAGSVLRAFSPRKARIGLIGLILGLAVVPVAVAKLDSRSSVEKAESLLLREQYEAAASMMLAEHPLGIGPNQFQVSLMTEGYGARAGVDWTQRIGIVHNIYWLTAAETGYAGLLALVLVFIVPVLSAFRYAFRAGRDIRGDVLLGLGVGLTMFYVHSLFEWVWRVTSVSYVFWIVVGMTATLSRGVRDTVTRRAVLARHWPTPFERKFRPGQAAGVARVA